MKKLNELYDGYPEIEIKDIKINSKEVVDGDLFVCIQGVTTDRNDYIDEAINRGASAIVTNKKINISVPVVYVKNPNLELSKLCQKFYDFNQNDFKIIATTGTNGKTTVSSIIKDMIGSSCAYIGTNGIRYNNTEKSIRNTTPSADRLYKYFKLFKESNCKIISMEASSEAFLRNRLDNLKYDIGIFTNIGREHLNVHKSLDNYIECKKELFENIKEDGYSILNIDDKYYKDFLNVSKCKILTYGKKESTLQIIGYKEYINKTKIFFKYNKKIYKVISPLVGEFNIYNLSAAILSLLALNYSFEDIIKRIKNIKVPKGRCELIKSNKDFNIILDYAHTKEAFDNIYKYLNKVKMGRIITVTGSAGGRDSNKRESMGKVVLDNSNYVIFTMDDPRYEDVNKIIDELIGNYKENNYERIIDREKAIERAFEIAKKNDIVLISGKGCDNYMAIKDKYIPYNDLDVINKLLNKG